MKKGILTIKSDNNRMDIGNCDIQLMLGCTDDLTAEYCSERSGEMSIIVDSTMTVKKTVAMAQVIPQYRETQGQGKRKLLTPDEVLRLPHEEMLVIIGAFADEHHIATCYCNLCQNHYNKKHMDASNRTKWHGGALPSQLAPY